MADFEEDSEEEKVEEFETFLAEALKCIIVVDGLPKVASEKLEKLRKDAEDLREALSQASEGEDAEDSPADEQ